MLPRINHTTTKAWPLLQNHLQDLRNVHLRDLFSQDSERFKKNSFQVEDILVDVSKNLITDETKRLLLQLATECRLPDAIEAMFNGELINETEGRSVLHVALRNFSKTPYYSAGKNVMEDVHRVQQQMKAFCQKVHSGEWKGYTGKKITQIVNIGIGGSDLGPLMVTEALKPYWKDG